MAQRPIIRDPHEEINGDTMEHRLALYEKDKQEYARIREEEFLNAPGTIETIISFIKDAKNFLFPKNKSR
jgi:hypothetical protein